MAKIQIVYLNPPRDIPKKTGGFFQVQDAETMIQNDDGTVVLGPLAVPSELIGKLVPGHYDATEKWERDYKSGRLHKVFTDLVAVKQAAKV